MKMLVRGGRGAAAGRQRVWVGGRGKGGGIVCQEGLGASLEQGAVAEGQRSGARRDEKDAAQACI
jgi:hypothetical protein